MTHPSLARFGKLCFLITALCAASACTTLKDSNALMEQHETMMRRQAVDNTQPQIDNKQVYLDMIETMQGRSLYFASLAHIDAYEAAHGASPQTRRLRADALRASGQEDAARQQYLSLLNTEEAAAAHHGLGLLEAQAGDYARSAEHLRKAIRLDPLDALALSDLGYACLLQGDIASARVPLIQAAELAPDNRKVIGNLALYLLLTGDNAKADALMDKTGLSGETRDGIARRARDVQNMTHTPTIIGTNGINIQQQNDGGMQLRLQTMLEPSLRLAPQ